MKRIAEERDPVQSGDLLRKHPAEQLLQHSDRGFRKQGLCVAAMLLAGSIAQCQIPNVQQKVTVSANAPTPLAQPLDERTLQAQQPPQPGRGLLNTVIDTPGWIFEANGVPHPRESEYQTTFIIDGVPRTENLSPSFAAPPEANEFSGASVLTSGYPAEYGRSLGGVVRLDTAEALGVTGALTVGSFNTVEGALRAGYRTVTGAFEAFTTDRFLDPTTTNNYTNHGWSQNLRLSDRVNEDIRMVFDESTLARQVPNELVQQGAGQLQTVHSNTEGFGAVYSHSKGDRTYGAVFSARHEAFTLDSNENSTPILFDQDRGFNEIYGRFSAAGILPHQLWRAGGDAFARRLREADSYTITNPDQFDEDTSPSFQFGQKHGSFEPALYAEDEIRFGHTTVLAGLRWDDYQLILRQHGWSPRVTVIQALGAHVAVHGSYDRVFQTPSFENLLVASASTSTAIEPGTEQLPVSPGRANFYELGASWTPSSVLTATLNVFLRKWQNFEDDDTILSTGVSIPFTDRSANVHGEELALRLARWRGWEGALAYSNQVGIANGPITGGLLLGDEGDVPARFAISQDERNTVRAHVAYFWSSFHVGFDNTFNSGLPADLDSDDTPDSLAAQYGPAVVAAINLDRGRVKPWDSTDLTTGGAVGKHLGLDFRVTNVGNGLHVINFASLFSGTALATPRSYSGRFTFHW